MRLPFSRRRDANYYKGISQRSTRVPSAEAAWPQMRSTRGRAENLEALERIRRRRANGTD